MPDLASGSDSGKSSTDNLTNITAPTFIGTAGANSLVELYDTDGITQLGTTTASAGGTWSITSDPLGVGEHLVTATDGASLKSSALSVTIDTLAPAVGKPDLMNASDSGVSSSDNLTNKTTPNFTGTAEAGATVTLYDTDGTTALHSTTANGMGKWTITSSLLTEGAHMVSATATDPAGNVSAASSKLTVTIDTTPLATAPDAPTLDPATDSGVSNSDQITSVSGPDFLGTGSDPNCWVNLYADGTLLGTTLSDGSGNYTYSATFLADGEHIITAKNVDDAGNIGPASSGLTITIDMTTPDTTIATIALSNDTGASASDFITKTSAQTISGTTTAPLVASEIVEVSLDNGNTWTVATTTGLDTWSLSGQTLMGSDTLRVRVSDLAGNPNTAVAQAYVLDTTAPTTTVASLTLSADTGSSSTDFITKTASQTINGVTSANLVSGEYVEVSFDNGTTWTTASSSVGGSTWSLAHSLGASSTLIARVSDTAGNTSSPSSQAYVLDTTATTTTIATIALSADTGSSSTDFITKTAAQIISGTTSANIVSDETVEVSLDNGSTWSTAATSTGANTWSLSGQTLVGSNTLRVRVADAAGNAGTALSQAFVLDQSAPAAPATPDLNSASDLGNSNTDDLTSATTPMFSGTADANSTVTLYDTGGTTVLGTGLAGGGGDWSITSSSLSAGAHTLTAKATDAAGNVSVASSGLGVTIDATAPTLTITSAVSQLKIGETATVTFTFSEDPGSTFTWNGASGDVVVTGGTLSAISGSGLTRAATFTPTASTNGGTAGITVASATYTDAAGNTGGGGTTPAIAFDTLAPTLAITSEAARLRAGQTATITFTFSEDPGSSFTWDGTSGDVAVTGGTLGAITGTGLTRTATFTPAAGTPAGTAGITVASRLYADTAGNTGGAGTTPAINIDTVRPTATISVAGTALATGKTSLVTIVFSEPVSGFDNVDLTAANGTLSTVDSTDGGVTWAAVLTPTAGVTDTTNEIMLNNVGVADAAGNAGTGTTSSNNYTIDTAIPAVPAITSPALTDAVAPVIAGTAETGSTVTVTVAGATYSTLAAGGAWSIDLGAATPANGSLALNTNGPNGLSATATDAAGNVSATANQTLTITPPAITGAVANQGVPDQTPCQPFSTVTVVDPGFRANKTLTVTLSAPGNGTLSNLSGGGTYDAASGVYSVTGTPDALTAALHALVFTPAAQPGVNVTTTGLAIALGSNGPVDTRTSVTSVRQVLGLAEVPTNLIFVSVSPDGSGFAAPRPGMTNEAVVSDPALNATYTIPAGYQALFVGGTAGVTLSDTAAGNALLVANAGNDQLFANAPNDVLVAGSGNDSLFGGDFASTVAGGTGAATVFAGTGLMHVIVGAGPLAFGGNSNAGSSIFGGTGVNASDLSANLTGQNQTVSVGDSAATVTVSGSGGNVIGGGLSLNVTLSGTANTIQAGSGSNAVFSSGSGNMIVGGSVSGSGPLQVFETGTNDTISAGTNPTRITATGATHVLGGSGSLDFVGGAGASTVFGGTGSASVTAGSGGVVFNLGAFVNATANSGVGAVTVFGAPGATLDLTGNSGRDFLVAGSGNETLNAAASSSSNWLSVNTTVSSSAAALVGGSGSDTLIAGSAPGSTTMTGGGGSDAFVFFRQAVGGAHDVIMDFGPGDSVYIEGYAASRSAGAIQSAAEVSSAGLTLTLSDGTSITFSNLSDRSALSGRIQYG